MAKEPLWKRSTNSWRISFNSIKNRKRGSKTTRTSCIRQSSFTKSRKRWDLSYMSARPSILKWNINYYISKSHIAYSDISSFPHLASKVSLTVPLSPLTFQSNSSSLSLKDDAHVSTSLTSRLPLSDRHFSLFPSL